MIKRTILACASGLMFAHSVMAVEAVKVNDQTTISAEVVTAYLQAAARGQSIEALTPQQLEAANKDLVNMWLLSEYATTQKLQETASTQATIELLTNQILAREAVSTYLEQNPVSEEQVTAAYKAEYEEKQNQEYQARHILVKEESLATELLEKLAAGGSFEDLAAEHSLDPGSQKKGGDLGWFNADRMVPAFAAAVKGLAKGERSKTAIKTRYGFHIIELTDMRTLPAPEQAAVAEQLKGNITQETLQAFIAELRSKAGVVEK